jgi:hypothetical protein
MRLNEKKSIEGVSLLGQPLEEKIFLLYFEIPGCDSWKFYCYLASILGMTLTLKAAEKNKRF